MFHARKLTKVSTSIVRSSLSTKVVQTKRPTWLDFQYEDVDTPAPAPPKTVDDSALQFEMTATFNEGSAIFYPHLKINPADAKVKLTVNLKDLNLTAEEIPVFRRMAGLKYDPSTQKLKLTTTRFPNRIENKEYLTYELETLLAATRELVKNKDKF